MDSGSSPWREPEQATLEPVGLPKRTEARGPLSDMSGPRTVVDPRPNGAPPQRRRRARTRRSNERWVAGSSERAFRAGRGSACWPVT